MKHLITTLLLAVLISGTAFSQNKSTEVLYFKAKLPCCKARSCNALQADVKDVTDYFEKQGVAFRVIMLTDQSNKELIEKYNAKSQTVLLVKKKRRNEKTVDLTAVVAEYKRTRNKSDFEEKMKLKIQEVL